MTPRFLLKEHPSYISIFNLSQLRPCPCNKYDQTTFINHSNGSSGFHCESRVSYCDFVNIEHSYWNYFWGQYWRRARSCWCWSSKKTTKSSMYTIYLDFPWYSQLCLHLWPLCSADVTPIGMIERYIQPGFGPRMLRYYQPVVTSYYTRRHSTPWWFYAGAYTW